MQVNNYTLKVFEVVFQVPEPKKDIFEEQLLSDNKNIAKT